MPLAPTTYAPPLGFRNPHLQTIVAGRLRRVRGVRYERERIETPDGDFLDLDASRVGADRAVVISHGLEGSADRAYVRGMARALNRHSWDALAWNLRGCSGEPNRRLRLYHSGATEDLDAVVQHVRADYDRVALVGFSLGGNITLKYLGERGDAVDPRVRRAVALSVPVDLAASSVALARWENALYMRYFLRSLRRKVRAKAQQFPGEVSTDGLGRIRDFRGFDDRYTAPLHGFADADDYWRRSSSEPFLGAIRVPTLLVNAADDPFLTPACYPTEIARQSDHFWLETPAHGGHVGFVTFGRDGEYWSERRAADFLDGRAPDAASGASLGREAVSQ
jgi:predicted alpha/beta-fold hydrolase